MRGAHTLLLAFTVCLAVIIFAQSNDLIVKDKDDDDDANTKAKRAVKMFNFASQSAGAVILDKSPASAKGFHYLLNDDKDKYGISPCEEKKWVVIGLSEDILITSIEVSNYEKYSSTLKDFQLLASYSYPTDEWINLGQYTAKPQLGAQLFNVTDNEAHTRYLKVKFLTHYSDEALCTLSQIKVFGVTVIASFQQEVQRSDTNMRDMLNQISSEDFGELLLPSPDEIEEAKVEETPAVSETIAVAKAPVDIVPVVGQEVSDVAPSVSTAADETISDGNEQSANPTIKQEQISAEGSQVDETLGVIAELTEAHVTANSTSAAAAEVTEVCDDSTLDKKLEEECSTSETLKPAVDAAAAATIGDSEPPRDEPAREEAVSTTEILSSSDSVADKPYDSVSSAVAPVASVISQDTASVDTQSVAVDTTEEVKQPSLALSADATSATGNKVEFALFEGVAPANSAASDASISNEDQPEPVEATEPVVKSRPFERVAEQVKKYLPFEFNLFASTDEIVNETNAEVNVKDELSVTLSPSTAELTEESHLQEKNTTSTTATSSGTPTESDAEISGVEIRAEEDAQRVDGGEEQPASTTSALTNGSVIAVPEVVEKAGLEAVQAAPGVNETESAAPAVDTQDSLLNQELTVSAGPAGNVTVTSTNGADVPAAAVSEGNKTDTPVASAAAPNPAKTSSSAATPPATAINATNTTNTTTTATSNVNAVSNSSTSSSTVALNCFETLNFVEFSKKMRAKLQQKAAGNGSSTLPSSGNSVESVVAAEAAALAAAAGVSAKDNNVFRSLLQKIKTLEMNSAIVEMYTIQVMSFLFENLAIFIINWFNFWFVVLCS